MKYVKILVCRDGCGPLIENPSADPDDPVVVCRNFHFDPVEAIALFPDRGEEVPPTRALLKYRARLDRANAILPPEHVGWTKREQREAMQTDDPQEAGRLFLNARNAWAVEMALVLRDYDRLLAGLLPDPDPDPE